MRRGGAVVLLVTAVAGLVALAIEAASDKRDLAFTIGVVPSIVAADLRPGATACQAPIDVPSDFSRVRLRAGSGRSGQPLAVSVLGIPSGRQLATGQVRGGYAEGTDQTATVGKVDAEQKIGVCVRNDGTRQVSLYGNTLAAAPLSGAILGKRQLETDLSFVFLDDDSQSMLAQLPQVFERASVFRPGFAGPWLFWVLAAAVLLGVPVLLARALADADEATRAP
jgi:hypothetical protein